MESHSVEFYRISLAKTRLLLFTKFSQDWRIKYFTRISQEVVLFCRVEYRNGPFYIKSQDTIEHILVFFQNEGIFVKLGELDELDKFTHA